MATIAILIELNWDPCRADLWRDSMGLVFHLKGPFNMHPIKKRRIAQYGKLLDALHRDARNLVWDSRPDQDNCQGPTGAYDCSIVKKLLSS